MIPSYRTHDYAVWRACERFYVRPPHVMPTWDEMSVWAKALLLGYDQVRQFEEAEELSVLVKSRIM